MLPDLFKYTNREQKGPSSILSGNLRLGFLLDRIKKRIYFKPKRLDVFDLKPIHGYACQRM
jgi:hypothetical protein